VDTKKDKCKFTIQFNNADSHHLQAVEILNAQGRRKAQFITNAILHYINCSEMPSIPQRSSASLDYQTIEAIVNKILQLKSKTVQTSELELPAPKKKLLKSDKISFDDAVQEIGEDALAAITNTVDLFRKK